MRRPVLTLCLLSVFMAMSARVRAQQEMRENIKQFVKAIKVKHDTNYISKKKYLTIKAFAARNYIDERYVDNPSHQTLKYQANTPVSVGMGVNYRGLGFSFSVRTGLVKDYEKYGKTKSFDLSTQIFLPKIAVDIYGSYYKGYYVTSQTELLNLSDNKPYYIRPDLHTLLTGINGEYILNAKKFSFASPFSQTQYQKKSAGSFLFGAGAFAIFINADSSIVPKSMKNKDFFDGNDFNRSNIYSIIVNGGYAYTQVIHKTYFISGSLNLGAGLSYTTLSNTITDDRNDKLGAQLDMAFRVATGYNSERYYAGVQYIRLVTRNMTPIAGTREDLGAGSFRLVLAKKIQFRHKVIDRAINNIMPQ